MRQRAAPRVIAHRLVVLDIAIGPIARPAHVVLDIIFVFVFILFVVRRAAVREAVGAVIVISAGVIRAHHAAALKQPHAASAQLLVNRLVRCLQRLDHGVAFCAFRHGARVLQLPAVQRQGKAGHKCVGFGNGRVLGAEPSGRAWVVRSCMCVQENEKR
eukprot:365339-Chlamydomonas_euryale.AAC.3